MRKLLTSCCRAEGAGSKSWPLAMPRASGCRARPNALASCRPFMATTAYAYSIYGRSTTVECNTRQVQMRWGAQTRGARRGGVQSIGRTLVRFQARLLSAGPRPRPRPRQQQELFYLFYLRARFEEKIGIVDTVKQWTLRGRIQELGGGERERLERW